MPLSRARQWRTQNQYQSLNEYNLVKSLSPPGIYLSLTPGNFSLWSGVLFLRSGPYAPGILRFQIAFPQQYPAIAPLILFSSDIFHPLITPLTTYTYSTATPGGNTVSSGDDERLLPGGLSLRHGFPAWFGGGKTVPQSPATENMMFKDIDLGRRAGSGTSLSTPFKPGHKRPLSFHIPPPKEDAVSEEDIPPSIVEVLYYMKRVFEDETLLDDLPLEVVANTGAWYAWQAHRRKTSKPLPKLPSDRGSIGGTPPSHGRSKSVHVMSPGLSTPRGASTPVGSGTPSQKKTMADWNWDGVWSERVKKGITMSLSDSVLYGNGEGDDLIHFLEADDESYSIFKEALPSPGFPSRQVETSPQS